MTKKPRPCATVGHSGLLASWLCFLNRPFLFVAVAWYISDVDVWHDRLFPVYVLPNFFIVLRRCLVLYNGVGSQTFHVFTSKGRLISGGSVERQFYPDVYISRARTAVRSPLHLSPKSQLRSGALKLSLASSMETRILGQLAY